MKNSTLALVVLLGLCGSLAAFSVPQVAVLDTVLAAGVDPAAGLLVTSKIEEEFVNRKTYKVLDRANVERVLREKEFQLSSGIVKNEEIRQAGEYLGADLVVVANVSRIGQTYVISAKMIDVATGEIAAQASAERAGKIDLLLEIAREVGARLAGAPIAAAPSPPPPVKEKPPKPPKPEPEPKPVREKPVREPYEPGRFVSGLRVGANFASVGGDGWWWLYTDDFLLSGDTPYSKFGINAGGFFETALGRMLVLGIEVLYSQKGYNYELEDFWWDGASWIDLGLVTNRWTFSYLDVPVYLKLRLPGRFSPYLSIGTSLGFLLGGSVKSVYDEPGAQTIHDNASIFGNPATLSELGVNVRRLDTGLLVGLGADVALRRLQLNFDARYTLGLLSASGDFSMPNRVLAITTGIGFRR